MKNNKRNKLKDVRKEIAKQRIEKLFSLALDRKDDLSKRYIILARKISEKYNVPIQRKFKKLFCRKCNSLFIPSKTCRIRLKNINVVYTCFNCKNISRYRFK